MHSDSSSRAAHAPRFVAPRALGPGSHLRLIAPAGPFDRDAFQVAVERLRRRFTVTYDDGIFDRQAYLAGDDARRLGELRAALADPAVDALVAARGGYGAMRLLPGLDVAEVAQARKLLVGFSDLTALHALWQRAGLRSLHASMIAALGRLPEQRLERWSAALRGELPVEEIPGRWSTRGKVVAEVVGGNLAVLCALLGTPYFPPVDGAILLLEDIGEAPYRVDRMLTSLRLAGIFARTAGVLLGDFTRCEPQRDGRTVDEVLRERLGDLACPVLCGLAVGHGDSENLEVPLGALAELDADRGCVTFLQGAVEPRPDDGSDGGSDGGAA
ncbi:MAG: LD-carboxypeptidase [Polyangia bacterium]